MRLTLIEYEHLDELRGPFAAWWSRCELPGAIEIVFGDGVVQVRVIDEVRKVEGHVEYDTHWAEFAVSEPPPAGIYERCIA